LLNSSNKNTDEVLTQLLQRLTIGEDNPLYSLVTTWSEIVGYDLATHARLLDLKGRVLIIQTDHPTWGSLVLMRKKQILARLKAQFPELQITQIQIRNTATKRF
jgi:predicted nucleic acid-binding Zn ribbon protein